MPHDLTEGAAGRVVTRVLGPEALPAIEAEWDRLSAAALEENALYSRAYVTAGMEHLGEAAGLRTICVFRLAADGTERLIGLVPTRRTHFRYGFPTAVDVAVQNAFQTSGTPLIDRGDAEAAVDALLDAARTASALAPNLLLPNMRREGAFAQLLSERAARRGFGTHLVGAIRRPVLTRGERTAEQYFAGSIAPKRVRELRRTQRRLAEAGALVYRHVTDAADLRAAIEDFLRIEAAGWKGAAGTALLSRPETAAFARAAFSGTNLGAPIASADVLALDGQAIAVSVNLQVGRRSFAIKCAYDERFRRFSPGLVLESLVIEHLFASGFADEMDSCVTESGHVIQDLWDGAVEVGTLALRPAGARIGVGRLALDVGQAEQVRARLRSEAKERYHAARSVLACAKTLAVPGAPTAEARALRDRLDARTRKAMLTFSTAQPNGEFAAVLAAMI
jgi:CelD/BcsL family acetyltransferase involved in cellulose biosynthesis